jgi:hypothetical protein
MESGLIEPLEQDSVRLKLDSARRIANVMIRVKERGSGRWQLSGPLGPMSFAGPLQASLSARLPTWGRGLYDFSTYAISVGFIATAGLPAWGVKSALLPVIALERPFNPADGWRSGWQVSPAYGWRLTLQSYASNQAIQRLMPLVAGSQQPDPPLFVEVQRAGDTAYLVCEKPGPKFGAIRARLPLIIQATSAVLSF